jgi:tetratricopeptide (TPR) repeat protein
MSGIARKALLGLGLVGFAGAAFGQQPQARPSGSDPQRSAAYYNFAMAHLYGELAQAYGNRGEYVNKAIDAYRAALKLDPEASYIGEELADFYLQTGQIERATQEAGDLIKANPNNANAHKVLARIYAHDIGDPDQGQAKVNQEALKSAITEYKKVTDIDPKDIESLSMLARLYRVAQDSANAEKAYQALAAADPTSGEAVTGLATVYADRGDIDKAIDLLSGAADRSDDGRALELLAELYEQNKNYSKAADAWSRLLPLTNNSAEVRKHYAANLVAAGRTDEALSTFQSLAADDPKNLELQLQIVEMLSRKGDYKGAHEALARAQAIGNTAPVKLAEAELLQAEGKGDQAITVVQNMLAEGRKTQYNDTEKAGRIQQLDMLARMLRDKDRTQEAVATLRQIPDLNPAVASRVEVEVIDTLMSGHDLKGARQTSDAALKKFPNDRLIALEHAVVLGETGSWDAAVNELKAMPDAGSDREVLLQIAQLQEKAKKYADERKTLDQAEAVSKTPQEKQAIAFMRGAMFEKEKNFDAAEQQFRKLIADDPNNAGALNYLGYMLADRNIRLDEALKMITKALELDPGNGAYLDSLGWVHFRLNKLDQAEGELREALDKVGKDPTVHDHLGEVFFKEGKVREAVQQWEASVSEYKQARPSEQDPEEQAKVAKKLESAKVKIAEKK